MIIVSVYNISRTYIYFLQLLMCTNISNYKVVSSSQFNRFPNYSLPLRISSNYSFASKANRKNGAIIYNFVRSKSISSFFFSAFFSVALVAQITWSMTCLRLLWAPFLNAQRKFRLLARANFSNRLPFSLLRKFIIASPARCYRNRRRHAPCKQRRKWRFVCF